MDNMVLTDKNGNKIEANFLFAHYDEKFKKNYVIYQIEKDLLASSYEMNENKYVINNDLTSEEYDMLDKLIESKMGELK